MTGPIELNVSLLGHTKIDFDRRTVRRTLMREGRVIQRLARRKVARRAVSQAGQYPGRVTGALQRAIDMVVARNGFWVRIEPTTKRIKEASDVYYPAILNYGSRKRNIQPRGNYMTDALAERRDQSRAALAAALQDALTPRK